MNDVESLEEVQQKREGSRAVTVLSIVFGFLGMALMSGLASIHDSTYPAGPLMIGTHMPAGGFTYMVFIGLCWNGLMALLGRITKLGVWHKLTLSPKELVVVLVMTLAGCYPPTSGLFRYFHRTIILPWYYLSGKPSWISTGVVENLPSKLFPSPFPFRDEMGRLQMDPLVYRGMISGLSSVNGNVAVSLANLPLRAWMGCLCYWGPLIGLMALCVISLQFLVHRQWAHHEQLGYPVAQVAYRFCSREDGKRGVPDLFRNSLFWWGMLPILLLYASDYLALWFPTYIPRLGEWLPNLKIWGVPLVSKIPALSHVPAAGQLAWQWMFFTIIGLSYFVSTEISLTMGLSQFLLTLAGLAFFQSTGTPLGGNLVSEMRVGAYVGYTAILLYTGRTYFKAIFSRALFPWRAKLKDEAMGADDANLEMSVLAARTLLLSLVAFIVVLTMMGFDWMIAVFYALLLMMMFMVFTRIICETGIFFMQTNFSVSGIITSMLGPAAVGPATLSLMMWTNSILVEDPRECLMPYVATGVKVADESRIKLKKIFLVVIAAVLCALVVSYLASSYTLYNYTAMRDGYASRWSVEGVFNNAAKNVSIIEELGQMEASSSARGIAKLRLASPAPDTLPYVATGIILVIGCSMMRFRFAKFPIHPVLFMVWGTYPSSFTWASFLVGWFIKTLVVRFGGGGVYQRLKPLFVGIISGELLAVGLNIVVNMTYLWITGKSSTHVINIMLG